MRSVISDTAGDRGRRVRSWLSAGCVAGVLAAGLLVGAATGAAANALTAVDLVTVSGVVSDGSGAPAPGTAVSFGGGSSVSTVTDANGAYTLHVLAGDLATLTFEAGSATEAPLGTLRAETREELQIGATDIVADLSWPAHAQLRTTVTDATSTPMAGIVVSGPASSNRFYKTLSNGAEVELGFDYPSPYDCTTDAAGQCSFPSLIGGSANLSATTPLVPGDSSYPTLTAYANASITTNPTDATIAFTTNGLVTLSGVVSDGSGAPAPGTAVSFGGGSSVSTVTDANGAYTLHVLAGDLATLTFEAGSATEAPLGTLRAETREELQIGATDIVADLSWPAHAQLRTTVTDATSTPMAGIVVSGPASSNRFYKTLSNGAEVELGFDYPSPYDCTTDAAGQCSFPSLIGGSANLSATTPLVPGDSSYPTLTAYANASITTNPTDATIAFTTNGLVTLSGVVSDGSGAPAPGTAVSFGGGSSVSTVTDANGAYTLHVLAGDLATLTFEAGSATEAPLGTLRAETREELQIGATDIVADLSWPAHAQLRTTVTDATSTPMAGIVVSGPASSNRFYKTLSNGAEVELGFDYPSPYDCTTDAAGQCSFPSLIGGSANLSATTPLVPGDSSYPTLTAYANASITTNPADTTLTFVNLTSFVSAGSVSGAVVVGSSDGTVISNVSVEPVPAGALPAGAIALMGALRIR